MSDRKVYTLYWYGWNLYEIKRFLRERVSKQKCQALAFKTPKKNNKLQLSNEVVYESILKFNWKCKYLLKGENQ